MAISINYPTGVIFVPKADTTLVQSTPFELRSFDLDQFWRDLRAEEDSVAGRAFPRIVDSDPPQAAFNLSRSLTITDYYSVEFDDASGTDAYRVDLDGPNSNVADVAVLNLVQVRPKNSAGLAQSVQIGELHTRFDLDSVNPQTYADDGSTISNNDFTLTKTDNGNGTFDITRS